MAVAKFTFRRFGMMLCLVWNRKEVTLVGRRFHTILYVVTASSGVAPHSCALSNDSLIKWVAERNLSGVCKWLIGISSHATKGI